MNLNEFVCVPIPTEVYLELIKRFPTSANSIVESQINDFLERTKEDFYSDEASIATFLSKVNGYNWSTVFLPHLTKIRMKFMGKYHYAAVIDDKILYEDEIYSPSKLANTIAGHSRNAWDCLWIQRPNDSEWHLAKDLRNDITNQ